MYFQLMDINAYSQKALKSFPFSINGTLKENYEEYKAGTPIQLCTFLKFAKDDNTGEFSIGIIINNTQIAVPYTQLGILNLELNDNDSFWEYKALQNYLYSRLIYKGYQYDLRQDLKEESTDYIRKMSKER